jgi:putative membrane protein
MGKPIQKLLKTNWSKLLLLILVIFYTVGTVGLLLPERKEYFLSLSFFNLTLSFVILVLARKKNLFLFFIFLIICFIVGFSAELIGTRTGWLFGSYYYGTNLGYKIYGVPLVIGLNWGILIVTSASIANLFKFSNTVKVILSVLLMILLDYLMEPVAIKSDFWHWKNETIPIYNYISWGLIALPLQIIYFKFKIVETNIVFNALFIILSIFFIILNLF